MPSRRIGSNVNLCPQQLRTVDAFDTFNSDTVNKLTRIISNNNDGVIHGLDLRTERYLRDEILTFDIFKSGQLYNESDWVFDTEKCEIGTKTVGYLDGFIIRDITNSQAQKITLFLDPNINQLKQCIGTHTKCVFHCKFRIKNGSPYKVIASIDEDTKTIEYPRYVSDSIELDVEHSLYVNTLDKKIELSLTFILIPEDYNSGTYGENIIKKHYYNGQSEIVITDLDYSLSLLSYEDKLEYYKIDNQNNYNYPISSIHPSHKIIVTQGVAVKDDVLLQEFGKDKNGITPTMVLDVSDKRCWLKQNPFLYSDFYEDGSTQTGYILNKEKPIILNGSVNTENNNLEFNLINGITLPIDDYQTSYLDKKVSGFHITKIDNRYRLDFPEFSFNDSNELYGHIIYLKTKDGKIIYRLCNVRFTYVSGTYTYEPFIEYLEQDTIIVDPNDIEIYISAGPIKVSGNIKEHNPKMTKWANVVIYYTYFKHPDPNKSYIGLIRDEDLNDSVYREDYLVLGKVRFISPNTIDLISYENRQQIYFPTELARNIDYINQIPPEFQKFWINPFTHQYDAPVNVSDALTKLARWVNKCIGDIVESGDLYISDVIENQKKYFEQDKIVSYIWDSEKKQGHLLSKYSVDTTELTDSYEHVPSSKLIKDSIDTTELTDSYEHVPSSKLIKDSIDTESLTDSDTHVPSSKLTEILLDSKQDKLSDQPGKVLYACEDDNIEFRPILYDNMYVCTTQEEVDKCKLNGIDYNYILKKWIKWGHFDNKQYGIDSDYVGDGATSWKWDNSLNRIVQQANSSDSNGFVSNYIYNDINVECRFLSTSTDNDYNGLCLMTVDSTGRQHTIIFSRSLALDTNKTISNDKVFVDDVCYNFICDLDHQLISFKNLYQTGKCTKQYNNNNEEILAYSYRSATEPNYQDDIAVISSDKIEYLYSNIVDNKTCPVYYRELDDSYATYIGTKIQHKISTNENNYHNYYYVVDKSSTDPMEGPFTLYGWKHFSGAVQLNLIYKKEDPNKNNHTTITCKTTPFYVNNPDKYEYKEDYNIVLDIDELIESQTDQNIKDILKLFKNGCRWGFYNCSQPQSYFQIVNMNIDNYHILDMYNNTVWKLIDDVWVDSGIKPQEYLNPGTQYYNSITQNLLWSDIDKKISIISSLNSNQYSTETWIFEDFDDNTITKTIVVI